MRVFVRVFAVIVGVLPFAAVPASAAGLEVRGSARQVAVTGLPAGTQIALLSPKGRVVASRTVNALGGSLFRDVQPGAGYRVRVERTRERSKPVTVHDNDPRPWDPSVYDQPISTEGYGYLTTRDGTKLAYAVHLPTRPASLGVPGATVPAGLPGGAPYPTLVEYAGYGYADPKGPASGIAVAANLAGFAVVDVSMRGTGCSGGAYDFFEPLQQLDGYDVIETIARQPWVKGRRVGMMGISYGGISQLFTAQTQPPSLAAISPLSVIDATPTTLFPGGITNTGFAVNWAKERIAQGQPAGQGLQGTQPYAEKKIAEGDPVCRANQALHPEQYDLLRKIRENRFYDPQAVDPLDPISFVNKIQVPTFMACQFEDEQTGAHCPDLVSHMTGTSEKWFTFTNGSHPDSLDPATVVKWIDFLSLYVANEAPQSHAQVLRAVAPALYDQALGIPAERGLTLPNDPVQDTPDYTTALARFKALPRVRILFDNGAGTPPSGVFDPGAPYAGFERGFSTYPVPGTLARTWYLGAGGKLTDRPPTDRAVDRYRSDPKAVPLTSYGPNVGPGGLWADAALWDWRWKPHPAGTSVSYLTPPLESDLVAVGAGSVRVWLRSSSKDVDLLATISEVTPDDKETFVQNGYLRASHRKLSRSADNLLKQPSSLLDPVPVYTRAAARPLPRGRFVPVDIPLYPQGHAYRKGTRVRLTISAPNGSQPVWSFDNVKPLRATPSVRIELSPKHPSRLVLPSVPGVEIPTPQPPCPSLRNEPCRPYAPTPNDRGG